LVRKSSAIVAGGLTLTLGLVLAATQAATTDRVAPAIAVSPPTQWAQAGSSDRPGEAGPAATSHQPIRPEDKSETGYTAVSDADSAAPTTDPKPACGDAETVDGGPAATTPKPLASARPISTWLDLIKPAAAVTPTASAKSGENAPAEPGAGFATLDDARPAASKPGGPENAPAGAGQPERATPATTTLAAATPAAATPNPAMGAGEADDSDHDPECHGAGAIASARPTTRWVNILIMKSVPASPAMASGPPPAIAARAESDGYAELADQGVPAVAAPSPRPTSPALRATPLDKPTVAHTVAAARAGSGGKPPEVEGYAELADTRTPAASARSTTKWIELVKSVPVSPAMASGPPGRIAASAESDGYAELADQGVPAAAAEPHKPATTPAVAAPDGYAELADQGVPATAAEPRKPVATPAVTAPDGYAELADQGVPAAAAKPRKVAAAPAVAAPDGYAELADTRTPAAGNESPAASARSTTTWVELVKAVPASPAMTSGPPQVIAARAESDGYAELADQGVPAAAESTWVVAEATSSPGGAWASDESPAARGDPVVLPTNSPATRYANFVDAGKQLAPVSTGFKGSAAAAGADNFTVKSNALEFAQLAGTERAEPADRAADSRVICKVCGGAGAPGNPQPIESRPPVPLPVFNQVARQSADLSVARPGGMRAEVVSPEPNMPMAVCETLNRIRMAAAITTPTPVADGSQALRDAQLARVMPPAAPASPNKAPLGSTTLAFAIQASAAPSALPNDVHSAAPAPASTPWAAHSPLAKIAPPPAPTGTPQQLDDGSQTLASAQLAKVMPPRTPVIQDAVPVGPPSIARAVAASLLPSALPGRVPGEPAAPARSPFADTASVADNTSTRRSSVVRISVVPGGALAVPSSANSGPGTADNARLAHALLLAAPAASTASAAPGQLPGAPSSSKIPLVMATPPATSAKIDRPSATPAIAPAEQIPPSIAAAGPTTPYLDGISGIVNGSPGSPPLSGGVPLASGDDHSGCWLDWWIPPTNMLPHLAYPPAVHGNYYFRPYSVSNLQHQQAQALQWGVDPRQPYSSELFRKVYAEMAKKAAARAAVEKALLKAPGPPVPTPARGPRVPAK
jgi:hypothetical protein